MAMSANHKRRLAGLARAVVLGGLVVGLVACTGVTPSGVVAQRGQWEFYSPSYVHYTTAPGEVRTIIFGAPFGMDQAEFERRVTDLMAKRPLWSSAAKYVTGPSEKARAAMYVVLVFNPPVSYDGQDACAKKDKGGGPAGGEVRLVAAYCSTVHMLSEVTASASDVSGPNDPRFAQLIRQTMILLFPNKSPHFGPGPFGDEFMP